MLYQDKRIFSIRRNKKVPTSSASMVKGRNKYLGRRLGLEFIFQFAFEVCNKCKDYHVYLRIWKPQKLWIFCESPWKCPCINCWGRRRAKAKSFHLIPQDYIWDLIHDCHKRDQSNWQESLSCSFLRSLQWCNCRLDSPFLLEWTPHTKEKSSDIKWEWDFMKIAEGAYWK